MKINLRFVFVFLLFGFNLVFSQSNQKFVVVLDAGHGAHDYGAIYHGHIEKNITLAIALKVGEILEKKSDIKVIYTRKTDLFVDLIERANIANRANANVFVSIHCNANKNNEAFGSETYVMGMSKNASNLEAAKRENEVITLEKDYKIKYEGYDPKSPESLIGMTIMQEEFLENSISLAGKIQNHFIDDLTSKSRGVKQAPYMVLHKAYMPRVLIEAGFISNPTEGAKLDSKEGQQAVAKAIADAIISYKKDYFGTYSYEESVKPSQKMDKEIGEKLKDTSFEKVISKDKKVNIKEEAKTVVKKEEKNKENEEKKLPADNSLALFKVQISASVSQVELVPSNFKGLKNISVLKEGSMYKYMYGETLDYNEAKKLLSEAKSKGFSTAFIIAMKNGAKIPVQEALKQ